MTWTVFLRWASGPGVSAIVAALLSVAVEYWPWYGRLTPKPKRVLYAGFCLVVPIVAALLQVVSGHVALSFDPLVWDALVAGAAAIGVGTLAHTPRLKTPVER
ncbi:MAG TPA: hypothetical protein VMY40_09525 [Anaerolineae bacterium]|nr:hypothetical protein [Anaerolineae bacterium]